jgi:hypothetical protein
LNKSCRSKQIIATGTRVECSGREKIQMGSGRRR